MLYAIGDLHLSIGSDKPMHVFGAAWENYENRIIDGFSALQHEDVCVICGDISWGMSLQESVEDFKFIDRLGGRKIILKGNHDYWWTTASKARHMCAEHGLTTIDFLNNNAFRVGEIAICGTRGWFYEEEKGDGHDKKIMQRELMRLETSLKAAGDCAERICFLHYPPVYKDYECREMLDLLNAYGVRRCFYGHIHGPGLRCAVQGGYKGIGFRMVSADYVGFKPVKIDEKPRNLSPDL